MLATIVAGEAHKIAWHLLGRCIPTDDHISATQRFNSQYINVYSSVKSFSSKRPLCNMVAATISANPLKLDLRSHIKCLAICFIVTVATFQYGLDYALVGGFMATPGFLEVHGYYDADTQKWAIDPTVQQLISSLMTIGTFVGSLLVGPFSMKLGRKHGLWAASLLNAVATAIMLGTTSVGALYFARLLLGQIAV